MSQRSEDEIVVVKYDGSRHLNYDLSDLIEARVRLNIMEEQKKDKNKKNQIRCDRVTLAACLMTALTIVAMGSALLGLYIAMLMGAI
jgi:hypothetical protein